MIASSGGFPIPLTQDVMSLILSFVPPIRFELTGNSCVPTSGYFVMVPHLEDGQQDYERASFWLLNESYGMQCCRKLFRGCINFAMIEAYDFLSFQGIEPPETITVNDIFPTGSRREAVRRLLEYAMVLWLDTCLYYDLL